MLKAVLEALEVAAGRAPASAGAAASPWQRLARQNSSDRSGGLVGAASATDPTSTPAVPAPTVSAPTVPMPATTAPTASTTEEAAPASAPASAPIVSFGMEWSMMWRL